MPIFSKPNAIVYIRHNGLVLAGKKLTPARMSFKPDELEHMEVLNDVLLISTLADFFTLNGIKGKHVLVVLDDSVVFTKTITHTAHESPSEIVDTFIATMPLSVGTRSCVKVVQDATLNLYATNGKLYSVITDALERAGCAKVLAVTPATAYPTQANASKSLATTIQQYINDTTIRNRANFLHTPLV